MKYLCSDKNHCIENREQSRVKLKVLLFKSRSRFSFLELVDMQDRLGTHPMTSFTRGSHATVAVPNLHETMYPAGVPNPNQLTIVFEIYLQCLFNEYLSGFVSRMQHI